MARLQFPGVKEFRNSKKFTFGSAGEIQDVEFALARNGWTHSLLKKATGGEFFGLVREVLEGRAEICRVERLVAGHYTNETAAGQYLVDCDVKPFEPSGLTVAPESEQLPNRVRGQFVFDGQVGLYLSERQQNGGSLTGNQLRKELESEPVLPANVLDFFLANPHSIPKKLKKDENGNIRYTFFWGTRYRDARGHLCVRYLYFLGGAWHSDYYRLGSDWYGSSPAALRAS